MRDMDASTGMGLRLWKLLFWDARFQIRYGFYLLYGLLTVFYIALLTSLPGAWRENAAALLIFSDPAAMGLFFMGAIVLLEKSQRVTSSFAVSPLKAMEYAGSKVLSLGMISMVVAGVLGIAVGCRSLPSLLLGTFLSGLLFSLAGMIIATKITSLNQFILAVVPVEVLTFLPAILYLFGGTARPAMAALQPLGHTTNTALLSRLMDLAVAAGRAYPANVCMDLIVGRDFSAAGLFLTIVLVVLLWLAAGRCVIKMWIGEGGVRL